MPHETFTVKVQKRVVTVKLDDGTRKRYTYLSIPIPKPIQDKLGLEPGDSVLVKVSKV